MTFDITFNKSKLNVTINSLKIKIMFAHCSDKKVKSNFEFNDKTTKTKLHDKKLYDNI